MIVRDGTDWSDLHTIGRPPEELNAEFALKSFDMLAHCRLAHAEQLSGLRDAAGIDDGHKCLQAGEVQPLPFFLREYARRVYGTSGSTSPSDFVLVGKDSSPSPASNEAWRRERRRP